MKSCEVCRYHGSEQVHSRRINEVAEGLICVNLFFGFYWRKTGRINGHGAEVKTPTVPFIA